jgi:hypothetical protein
MLRNKYKLKYQVLTKTMMNIFRERLNSHQKETKTKKMIKINSQTNKLIR